MVSVLNIRNYTKFLSLSVLVLIFYGALVKSHEAGLAVPDWPSSFGENMFTFHPSKWVGIIYYEHLHRLIASVIGALTLILALWLWITEKRRGVKILGFVTLFAVILQGLLGGLTVIYQLPVLISASHGTLAQVFFCMTLVLAYLHSREWLTRRESPLSLEDRRIYYWSFALILVVFVQLIIGAVMRHMEAGLAVLDFPTMAGYYFPTIDNQMVSRINEERSKYYLLPVDSTQVFAHITHRVGALFVFIVSLSIFVVARKMWSHLAVGVKNAILIYATLLLVQISLGILSVLSVREPLLTSLHVVTGAALLGSAVVITLRAYSFQYKTLTNEEHSSPVSHKKNKKAYC